MRDQRTPIRQVSHPIGMIIRYLLLALWGLLLLAGAPSAASQSPETKEDIDFTELSLEELMAVKITSASKKPETISELPSAVFVITREDIRRSGATSLPEVLRMAPGVQVARISATEWAVNMRDLNQLFANKLLVLIDGRTVYSHVASGVFWDMQDTVLEDIDRIEVIRGPGAALWGVNAVNGVINIITRHAEKTQGGQVTALGGTEEGIGTIRYGAPMKKFKNGKGFYRIYGKIFQRGGLFEGERDISNDPSKSDWRSGRAGFRTDWETDEGKEAMTFQGEIFSSQFQTELTQLNEQLPFLQSSEETSRAKGGHLLGRWKHTYSEASDAALQFYYDYYNKDIGYGNVRTHTFNVDFQHRFSPMERNELIWGANWRFIDDRFNESIDLEVDPSGEQINFYSLFFQDKINLVQDTLSLTLGAKLEHNDYTGFEFQPSVRLLWTLNPVHSFWGAVSRAARVPSRVEHDGITSDFGVGELSGEEIPVIIKGIGNDSLYAETVVAYEIGYRFQPTGALWMDMTGYYNDYKDLITYRYDDEFENKEEPFPHVEVPVYYANGLNGSSYGFELAAFWQATEYWLLQGSYTFLETDLAQDLPDVDSFLVRNSNPRNQVSVRSAWNFCRQFELDLWFRYVDRLTENNVDAYTTLDARLAWIPKSSVEISLIGQNLLESRHAEFSSIEIERSIYVKLDWCF